jgi:hypothetical protein
MNVLLKSSVITLAIIASCQIVAQKGFIAKKNYRGSILPQSEAFYIGSYHSYTVKKQKSDANNPDTLFTFEGYGLFSSADSKGSNPIVLFEDYGQLLKNDTDYFLVIRKSKTKGVLNLNKGKVIISPTYQTIRFIAHDEVFIAQYTTKGDIFDKEGKQLNTVSYKKIASCSLGYYDQVQTGNNAVIYSKNNEKLVAFDNAHIIDEIDEGVFALKRNNKYGLVTTNDSVLLAFDYDNLYLNEDTDIIVEQKIDNNNLQTVVIRKGNNQYTTFSECSYVYIKNIYGDKQLENKIVSYYVIDKNYEGHFLDASGSKLLSLKNPKIKPIYATSMDVVGNLIIVEKNYQDYVDIYDQSGHLILGNDYLSFQRELLDYAVFNDEVNDVSYLIHRKTGQLVKTVGSAYDITFNEQIAIIEGENGINLFQLDTSTGMLGAGIITTNGFYFDRKISSRFPIQVYKSEDTRKGTVFINPSNRSHVSIPLEAEEIIIVGNTLLAISYNKCALIELDYTNQQFGKISMVDDLSDINTEDIQLNGIINLTYGKSKKLNNFIYDPISNKVIVEGPYSYVNFHLLSLHLANNLNELAKFIEPYDLNVDGSFTARRMLENETYHYINSSSDTLKNFISPYKIEFIPILSVSPSPIYEARVTFMGYEYELMFVSALFNHHFKMIQPFQPGRIENIQSIPQGYVVQRTITESKTVFSSTLWSEQLDEQNITQKIGQKKSLKGYQLFLIPGGIIAETETSNYILDYNGNLIHSGAKIYAESMSTVHLIYCDDNNCYLMLLPSKKRIPLIGMVNVFENYQVVVALTEDNKIAIYNSLSGNLISEEDAIQTGNPDEVIKDRIYLMDKNNKYAIFNLATQTFETKYILSQAELTTYFEQLK